MRPRSLLQALVVCVAIAGSAQASLNITIGDVQLVPGGSSVVDVSISGENDYLQAFSFEFRTTPTVGTSQLRFVDPQGDLQLSDSSYVFWGDSLATLIPPVGAVSTTTWPQDTFIGGDLTVSGADVFLPLGTPKLLARLEVIHDFGAADPATTIGHTFDVTLEPGSFFLDASGASLDYTAAPGQVTIIPEPSQLTIMLGLGGVFLVGCWWRRRKRWAGA